ncbi:winged helix DNA-binding domain-containing protein [Psychromicrobium sp. YIM B11713]|uniref:winged helix DNA-binding domain-containing protein n=1 Tax=Psychromicrobium sp. YIM B11713 TaxID=3145233 RepID=UPI00374EA10C
MKAPTSSLARLRLLSQALLASSLSSPVEAVRWMLALQAQDLPGALYSIGLRMPRPALSQVRAALDTGEVVRSWPMRGTLHLCAAEDLGWMLSLTGPRVIASMASRNRQLGISDADLGQVRDLALAAVTGGGASREELLAAFSAAGQPVEQQRGIHLIGVLCMQGHLVQGPMRGAKQLFMASQEWISQPRELDREEALTEYVRRYFRSHGPATVKDFCWWSKLPLRDARLGLAAVRQELAVLDVDSEERFLAPETLELPPASARSLLLLPGFDEFLLGYADRSHTLAVEHASRIVPGNNGMFMPTIVYGGRVVGTWRKPSSPKGRVELLPFEPLSPAVQRSAEIAAERYQRFLRG